MKVRVRFRLRIYKDAVVAMGPGKVDLLEAIAEAGSISGAARLMNMSYRRAWMLIETLNGSLEAPAVVTVTGGAKGGGARLTETGEEIIRRYRAIEETANRAAADDIAALTRLLKEG
ncbi:MAG: LysR family transcriptional regulator [Alcaligenaceae bacterium]|nr:LysR family transcriptional regulator [Alcaligenaceae bacterium]